MLCSDENCYENVKCFRAGYFVCFPSVVAMQVGWRLAAGIGQSLARLCLAWGHGFAALLGFGGRCGPRDGERMWGGGQH